MSHKQTKKYGAGYIRLIEADGSEVRVIVERRDSPAADWLPYPIKRVAKLAEAL